MNMFRVRSMVLGNVDTLSMYVLTYICENNVLIFQLNFY